MRVNKYICLSETAAILVLFLLEESLNDMAGHPPGSVCFMPMSGSEQVCSEPFSPDVHLPPVPSAVSCPVHFGGCHFPPSTALLDSLSFTLTPKHSPLCPPQFLPASSRRQPCRALPEWFVTALPSAMLLGLPRHFLAGI